LAVTGRAGFKRNVRKLTPAVGRGFDHADDRLNRAGATAGVRRRFKFRQFETNEFAHADELAHQRAQRRQV
jgi:hypothetical protein